MSEYENHEKPLTETKPSSPPALGLEGSVARSYQQPPSCSRVLKREALMESFSWMEGIDSFKSQDTGKSTIRIKGVAAKANSVSKNGRKYLDEELKKSVSSMVNRKVTVNHDDKRVIGNIIWADYGDGQLEYLAQINKEPYVSMLREGSTSIKGVSLQANYLYLKCPKCLKKFETQEAWANHMEHDEFIKDGLLTSHGIVFDECALSLVLTPETPGLDTTFQIAETVNNFARLCETVLQEASCGLDQVKTGHLDPVTFKPVYDKEHPFVTVLNKVAAEPTVKPVSKPKTAQELTAEGLAYLELHSDLKVREYFSHIIGIADRRVKDAEDKAGITETQTKLSETVNENTTLKETVQTQTQTITELNNKVFKLEQETKTIRESTVKREKYVIELENIIDKVKPFFKASTKLKETKDNSPVINDPMDRANQRVS